MKHPPTVNHIQITAKSKIINKLFFSPDHQKSTFQAQSLRSTSRHKASNNKRYTPPHTHLAKVKSGAPPSPCHQTTSQIQSQNNLSQQRFMGRSRSIFPTHNTDSAPSTRFHPLVMYRTCTKQAKPKRIVALKANKNANHGESLKNFDFLC